ncbi:MAG: hypothetical protein RLZZ524_1743, partial [Pseudomonadota bacterium]
MGVWEVKVGMAGAEGRAEELPGAPWETAWLTAELTAGLDPACGAGG